MLDDVFPLLPAALLDWYAENRRELPWRRDQEPYHVWLSEIMLQQTRVEAVRGYYTRFLEALPTISHLAEADPDALHKLWEGLGYYSRVRNLQKAAKVIQYEYHGQFPTDYKAVLALPGIGEYTAGAICSICFDQPTPAVDGNVLRVAARVDECYEPVTDPKVRRTVAQRLQRVYPAGHCGDFTQSLMELGATVCVPNGAPRCGACPCRGFCRAAAHGTAGRLPVKAAKRARRMEEKTVFLLRCEGCFAVVRRPDKGLLAGLWAFPHVQGRLEAQAALDQAAAWNLEPVELVQSADKVHTFTHIQWEMRGYYILCRRPDPRFTWVDTRQLQQEMALPTAFRQFYEAGPGSFWGISL